jgi:hypothetical protein
MERTSISLGYLRPEVIESSEIGFWKLKLLLSHSLILEVSMTRLHQLALATIIGLSVPTIVTTLSPTTVMAQEQKLNGVFGDDRWTVSVFYEQNAYRYRSSSTSNKTGIDLSGATIGGTRDRRTYTWNNGGTRYQAIWQQRDPDFIRVRVLSPKGTEIFNRLLKRQEDGC